MSKTTAWIKAMRLRTLPLAFSCILAGSAVAAAQDFFKWEVFITALITTLFLQILSNLANDYGDSATGIDNENRVGPTRGVQSGAISLSQMKKGIIITALLALVSGILLLFLAFGAAFNWLFLMFLLLGLGAIGAAVKYTMGKSPYGYRGLGDLFVFLFFGLIGVIGVWFLHINQHWGNTISGPDLTAALFPACAIGLLSAAVLNLNNLRDHENDKMGGKMTLVVKMGFAKAKIYHVAIVLTAISCMLAYLLGFLSSKMATWMALLALLPHVIFIKNIVTVLRTQQPEALDPELKKVALGTFFSALILFIVVLVSN